MFDAQGWYTKAINYANGQYRSPNFGFPNTGDHGNLGRKAVVLHVTAGKDSRGWLCNPASQVSATFLIREEGIYQLVSIHDSHYANGIFQANHKWRGIPDNANPNRYTISIEREGDPDIPVSAKIDALTIQLLRDLQEPFPQFNPYVPHQNLIGHYEISPAHRPNCPGPTVDFAQIATAANGAATVAPSEATTYRVRQGATASVRTTKEVTDTNRLYTIKAGATVTGYGTEHGASVGGDATWVKTADGYVHMSALKEVA